MEEGGEAEREGEEGKSSCYHFGDGDILGLLKEGLMDELLQFSRVPLFSMPVQR